MTARRLKIWAARLLMFASAVHLLLFLIWAGPYWSGMFGGELRGLQPNAFPSTEVAGEYQQSFWGGLGSFAVPLLLLALLIDRMARADRPLPGYLPWILLAWFAVTAVILVPGGFPLGVLCSVALIVAGRKEKQALREQE